MQKSVGQQLSTARKRKKLSLTAIAQELYIREDFLRLLEEDRYEELPSAAQARGFIRLYASFLKLDSAALLSRLVKTDELLPQEVEETQSFSEGEEKSQPRKNGWLQAFIDFSRTAYAKMRKTLSKSGTPPADLKLPLAEDSASPGEADEDGIVKDIGSEIRNNRESLGLSLEEVENLTKIKKKHLEWIESGDLDRFSSPIQARGMLQNYINYMGMDSERIMLRYANAILLERKGDVAERAGEEQKALGKTRTSRFLATLQFITPNLIIATILLATVVCLIAWSINRASRTAAVQATSSAPPISEVLMSTQQSTLEVLSIGEATDLALTEESRFSTPLPILTMEENGITRTPTPEGILQMNVSVNQRTYLLVKVDGVEKVNGRVKAGESFQLSANNTIEIASGNAAAISIVYGDNDLGIMGNPGEAFHLVFSPAGAFTPTPKASPTPTPTTPPTRTLTPTKTVPSPTITPYIP